MDGNEEMILDELFSFARTIMDEYGIYPYVSFLVKDGTIVVRGFNEAKLHKNLYGGDITLMSDVVTVRKAERSLDTNDLSDYILYSFFEPTILGFDVAMWARIRHFVWCVDSSSFPRHYNKIKYTPLDYLKNHPGKITIKHGIRQQEGLDLAKLAKQNKYYPDNLY